MQDRGWYVGGSLGKTEDNESCPTTSCDLKDSGWKIFAGYRVNRNFALEGAYADFGSFRATGPLGGNLVDITVDLTSFSGTAVGLIPIGERIRLFGKAGMSLTQFDGSGTVNGFVGSASDDDSELLLGLGATFDVTRNLAIRAEWERLNDSEVDMMSIGIQYQF